MAKPERSFKTLNFVIPNYASISLPMGSEIDYMLIICQQKLFVKFD